MLSCGVSPGFSRLLPELVAHAPVEVLARAVDAGERLLVQQAREAVLRRDALAASPSSSSGDRWRRWRSRRSARSRTGSARLRCGASSPARRTLYSSRLDLHHEGQHALGDGAEVLVLHLLALRRPRAEERAAGVDQVGTREVEVAVDQEVLLLGTAGRDDALGRASRTASGCARACFESASIERSSGVFLSSASPVQLTNAVGMTSVVPFGFTSSQGGLVGSHAV